MANREKVEAVTDYVFLGSKITVHGYCSREIKKTLALWKESYDKPSQCIKKQRHHFADKDPYSQSYGFSSSHVWMWELNHKEGWALKNWCFQIVVLEKTLESLLDCKEIKPVNPKENPEYPLEVKGCCWIMQRCQDSWPLEEKNSIQGQRWGLVTQSFCVIKFIKI